MIYSLSGKLEAKQSGFIVVETGGVGYKLFVAQNVAQSLPQVGSPVKVFCHLHIKQDGQDLYGFSNERELALFERLLSVSGVGPKSALGILNIARSDQLIVAINEGKIDLLTRASGVGKKTAERVVIELKGKLDMTGIASAQTLNLMESDVELEETLTSLGYTRQQAKSIVSNLDPMTKGFKERLKEALRKAKS